LRDNHTGTDPGFLAPDKLDFRLKPDATTLKTGFQPIALRCPSFEMGDSQIAWISDVWPWAISPM